MKKRIYSLVEIKSRELNGKILFSIQMANKGYSVVIGKKRSLYEYAKYFRKGIFFFKGMGPKNIKPMQELKKLGHKIVGSDEEGLVMNMAEIIPLRIDKACFKLVDYFFTVGNVQKRNTLKSYQNEYKKIISTGNPRFDLMKKPMRGLYNDSVKQIKKEYGKFIFFPSKFTMINAHKKVKDNFLKVIKQQETKTPNYKRCYKSDWDDQILIKKKLEKFFKYFPKKYPNIKILIKKHPTEKEEYWRDLVKKINCKNLIFVDDKYPTNAYLIAAEFSIGSNCHTSLESFFFEKPTINWRASKQDSYLTSKVIRAVSKELLDQKELENVCKDWFFRKKKFKNNLTISKKKLLSDNIENINNFSATIQKKYFDKIVLSNLNSYDKYSNKFSFYILEIIRKLKNVYYTINKTDKNSAEFYKAKFDGLNLNEYKHLIKKFCKLMNLNFDNYLIKEIYPGCFNIEKK